MGTEQVLFEPERTTKQSTKKRKRKALIKGAVFRVMPPNVVKFHQSSATNWNRSRQVRLIIDQYPRTSNGVKRVLGQAKTFCSLFDLPTTRISIQISYDQGENWRPANGEELTALDL